MSEVSYDYSPGGALAICGPKIGALLDLPADADLVPGLYKLIADAHGNLDDVLEFLVTPDVRAVPHFALAETGAGEVRVLVRGRYLADVGRTKVGGRGLWADRTISAEGYTLRDPESSTSPLALPLPTGVVLAGRLSGQVGAPRSAQPAVQPDAETAVEVDQAELDDLDAQFDPAEAQDLPEAESADHDAEVEQDADEAELAESGEPRRFALADSEEGGSGHTLPTQLTNPLTTLPSPPSPPDPVAATPGFIDSLPWNTAGVPTAPIDEGAQPPAAVPNEAPAFAPSDQPERTINREALAREGVQTVVAARCPDGHLSPAYAGACRVCGQPLPQQQPMEIPRPPLGVLKLSNGDVVTLDRGCVLGRNPRVPTPAAGERPNLVKLLDPDKDISGQHLEVQLEYWHVAVKDLGSTNGTQVVLPGENPVTLRPNDPMMIEPGTKVILAGVFSFTFEVTS